VEILKAGIIGLGGMGRCHLNALLSCKSVELAALCDINKPLLSELAEKLKVPSFTSFKEMLEKVKVDFVVIALPHWLHLKAVKEVSSRGVHILKEKPLARSYDEAKEIVRIAEENGVKLMVATQRRYARTFSYAKELVDNGLLGEVILIRGQYIFYIGHELGWRGSLEKAGGGALLDPGYHTIDLLYWYKGMPKSVYCKLKRDIGVGVKHETEDVALALFEYQDGCIGYIVVNWLSSPSEEKVIIHGTNGCILVSWSELLFSKPDGSVVINEKRSGNLWHEALLSQLNHFVDCIKHDKTPLSSGRENLNIMKIISACYESAFSGRKVSLH